MRFILLSSSSPSKVLLGSDMRKHPIALALPDIESLPVPGINQTVNIGLEALCVTSAGNDSTSVRIIVASTLRFVVRARSAAARASVS